MGNSNIIDSVSATLAKYFYEILTQTEDFSALESVVAGDVRTIGCNALRMCIEQFDKNLCDNMPRGWSKHEYRTRTLITLLGTIKFRHTIFLDEYGRHRALTCELLGIPKHARFSASAFLWIARCASELSYRKTALEFERLTNTAISHICVENIEVGGDGASWCSESRIETKVSKNCKVSFTLDLFHIMKYVVQAFPDKKSNSRVWATNLVMQGRAKKLIQMCKRITNNMGAGKHKKKINKLAKYLSEHISGINEPTHILGTMEGTNAHVGAARLKGHGRSWSRRGAEAMCLIRCAILTRRALVAPIASSWFSKSEIEAKENALPKSASDIPRKVGRGKKPAMPYAKLPKKAAIALSCS